MSTRYGLICLNHDPGLPIEIITGNHDCNSVHDATAIARKPIGEIATQHAGCDLVVAAYSGALVSIGCPNQTHHPYDPDGVWIDCDWLRLALAGHDSGADQLVEAITGVRDLKCWTATRLARLRPHLVGQL